MKTIQQTKQAILAHEHLVEILEAKKFFQERENTIDSNLKIAFQVGHLELQHKYLHKQEINQKCINRMNERYIKSLSELYINQLENN